MAILWTPINAMTVVPLNKRRFYGVVLGLCLGVGSAWAENGTRGFAIKDFVIDGNTLLPDAEIQTLLQPYRGDKQQFNDIQNALEALERHYWESGFGEVLVVLPEQELIDGKLHLQVIEPVLQNIDLQYAAADLQTFYSADNIRDSLPDLKPGRLLHTRNISRNVQLANENPAKQIEVVLRTQDAPGLLDAGVKVSALPPRKAFVTIDNTGTDQTGEYRMGFGLQHANLFGQDHVATFNYITPIEQPTHVNLFSGSYRIPLYAWGDSIDLMVAKSEVGNTTTPTVSGPLQFSGSGEIYGLNYNWLLPRFGEFTHRVIAGVSYRQFNNNCSLGYFGSLGCGPSGEDVSILPASLSYSGRLSKQNQTLSFYLTGAHNIPGMSKGNQTDFNAVRPANIGNGGAPADYYLFKTGYAYAAILGADWQMHLMGNGQYSSDPLLYVEQFGLAGSTTVRGFWEREMARDIGYVLNTEFYTPDISQKLGVGDYLRGLVFYDYGYGRNNPLKGEERQSKALNSVGVGLRFGFNQSFQLKFDGAYVLDGAVSHETGDARAHLSIYLPYSF